jgi:nicotinamidase-related amidase
MTDQKETIRKIIPALLVIDIQNKYLVTIPQNDKGISIYIINLLIDLFRKNGCPVIRIYHDNREDESGPGTEDFEYPPSIKIRKEDARIVKNYSDSFNKTELDSMLSKKGINTLFLCGLSAIGCVLATRIGAQNHDYKAFIVKDAIMSHNTEYTRNVEAMFDALSYDAVKLIVENLP